MTNGTPFSGCYTFDSAVADSETNSGVGVYEYADPACGVLVKAGNYVFRTNPDRAAFDEQVHQMASLADRIPAGGDAALGIVIALLVIVALVLLIIYLYRRV